MPPDLLAFPAVKFAFAVWLFAVGGAFGSFLNVVVYRLPAGMSLSWPGSHCPKCKHPIRWRDNLPILGWILLAGRCRDCRAAISFRYPLVETITATMFLLVGLVEGLSGGMNLPQRPWPAGGELVFRALTPDQGLGIAAFHLVLLTTLLAAALTEYDGQRLPARLAVPALVVGLIAPVLWPYLHPVPALLLEPDWLSGIVDGLAGLSAGLALGLAAWRLIGPRDRLGLMLGPAGVGLYLGWQAVAVIAAAVLAIHLAVRLAASDRSLLDRTTPGVWLVALTLAWILAWVPLARAWALL